MTTTADRPTTHDGGISQVDRTYSDWQIDAKQTKDDLHVLAAELRDNWKTWRGIAGHRTLDECMRANLGISSAALRMKEKRTRGAGKPKPDASTKADPGRNAVTPGPVRPGDLPGIWVSILRTSSRVRRASLRQTGNLHGVVSLLKDVEAAARALGWEKLAGEK